MWDFQISHALGLMQVYFKTIEGQTPDPEWDARLSQMSNKFRELKDKALSVAAAGAATAPTVSP